MDPTNMTTTVPITLHDPEVREKLFEELYETAFPKVAFFISRRNGTFQDAKDIFHDALVIFYEKIMEKKVEPKLSPEAYLLGIAKHLWVRKYNRERALISLDAAEMSITIPDDYFPSRKTHRLVDFLARAGKKCLEILQAFYYDKQPADEIARTFGYRNAHSATVQKFKCLEKIRTTVKEKSISYDDIAA